MAISVDPMPLRLSLHVIPSKLRSSSDVRTAARLKRDAIRLQSRLHAISDSLAALKRQIPSHLGESVRQLSDDVSRLQGYPFELAARARTPTEDLNTKFADIEARVYFELEVALKRVTARVESRLAKFESELTGLPPLDEFAKRHEEADFEERMQIWSLRLNRSRDQTRSRIASVWLECENRIERLRKATGELCNSATNLQRLVPEAELLSREVVAQIQAFAEKLGSDDRRILKAFALKLQLAHSQLRDELVSVKSRLAKCETSLPLVAVPGAG